MPDDDIGPEKLLHFLGHVVTAVNEGFLHIKTGTVHERHTSLMQGCVVTTIGVRELLAAVEEQYFFMADLSLPDPARLEAEVEVING